MELDARSVSAAIETAVAPLEGTRVDNGPAGWQAVMNVVEQLEDEYGVDAVIAELTSEKNDPFVAAALFQLCTLNDRRLRDLFSEEEIVEAALRHLLAVESRTDGIRTDGWAFSALWQHYYGSVDHFDDEEHFRIVLEVIERAPMDDTILFLMGDGPLSHAAGDPGFHERIKTLSTTNPKVARAWWLNETDGGRLA